MRTKKALLNTITALLLQGVTVICGFILPRIIIRAFGSEINGAMASITQFLGYISLIEAGVGGVTRAALYKPLANGETDTISGIFNATQGFFRKIAAIFIVYTLVLSLTFKYISGSSFSWVFICFMVWIIAINIICQYFFGITNAIILNADQSTYISSLIQIVTIILNTILSVLLIKLGVGILIVKLVSTMVFVLRPILLSIVVKKRYHINRNIPANNDAIKQRWNGLGHHIAYFLHNNTDIMVITVFLGLKMVSVYNVFFMIANGIRMIVNAVIGGTESAFGNMIAKGEKDVLNSRFGMMETLVSCVITAVFSTTGLLLINFVSIYTSKITDVNYILPVFGVLLVLSEAVHCIKQQYHDVVLAAGHYKETQTGAFIEAGLNIGLSILLVNFMGIEGVIIATIVSTGYRLFDYVIYLRKNILQRSIKVFLKRLILTGINAVLIVAVCRCIPFSNPTSYFAWVIKAIIVFAIACAITFVWNYIWYKQDMRLVVSLLKKVIKKK